MAGLGVDDIEQIWHSLTRHPMSPCSPGSRVAATKPDIGGALVFRPLMLSHALEAADWAALDLAQILRRMEVGWHSRAGGGRQQRGQPILAQRRGYLISLSGSGRGLAVRCGALDGELLVVRDGEVAPFNDLQQRLNRKAREQAPAGAVSRPRAPL